MKRACTRMAVLAGAVGVVLGGGFCDGRAAGAKRTDTVADGTYGATLAPARPARAVVVPAAPGALAAAIAAHGPGTTFYLRAGVHTGNGEMRPKTGSVFVGEAGSILDGGGRTAYCFVADTSVIPPSATAPRYVVTLRNLVIRHYAPPDQDCAVRAADTGQGWMQVLSDPGDRGGWLLDHCTLTENRAGGASLGSASTAEHCLAVGNGQVGFKATGRGVRLQDCRATGNNADRRFNYFWEAGGVKAWNVRDLRVEGGEYDHNGGTGIWTDYVWDGNVIRDARFHDNLRPGVAVEMTTGMEITGCTFAHDDLDGIAGRIPAAFRPWDKSPTSGPDLWQGEVFLFDAAGTGTLVHPTTHTRYTFTGRTWIHGNHIQGGNSGILAQYQDRAGIDALGKQMAGSPNGPIAGLGGIVAEDNDIACAAGIAAGVRILVNRDYKDTAGSWGPIPAAQAQHQFDAVVFRRNRYAGRPAFSVPRAALAGDTSNAWAWNDRADATLPQWRAVGKD